MLRRVLILCFSTIVLLGLLHKKAAASCPTQCPIQYECNETGPYCSAECSHTIGVGYTQCYNGCVAQVESSCEGWCTGCQVCCI